MYRTIILIFCATYFHAATYSRILSITRNFVPASVVLLELFVILHDVFSHAESSRSGVWIGCIQTASGFVACLDIYLVIDLVLIADAFVMPIEFIELY